MKYRNIGISSVGFASGLIESHISPCPFIHLAQNVSQNGTTSDIYQNFTSDAKISTKNRFSLLDSTSVSQKLAT